MASAPECVKFRSTRIRACSASPMPVIAMSKPALASALAMPSPMPRRPPVTRATGLANCVSMLQILRGNVIGDAQRLRRDRQRRIDGSRGRQEARIDDEEVRMIECPAIGVERCGCRIACRSLPCRIDATACACRRAARARSENRPPSAPLQLLHQHQMRLPVGPPPLQHDALAVDHDPAFRVRNVLAHRVEIDRMRLRPGRAAIPAPTACSPSGSRPRCGRAAGRCRAAGPPSPSER